MKEAPFFVGQRVVCVEKKPLSKVNSIFNEKIVTDNVYVVDAVGDFTSPYYPYKWVKVGGMATKWDVLSFAPIEEQKEKIRYVAVSETLREAAVGVAAIETN